MAWKKKNNVRAVSYTLPEKERKPRPPQERVYVPNAARAVTSGEYAVIIDGSRRLIPHKSGEPLKGQISQ